MDTKKIVKYVSLGFIAILALGLLFSAFYEVSPGYRGVMVTLGKVEQRSITNGVGVKWPFISEVVNMNIQTNALTEEATSYTADVQTANLKYTFTYELVPDNVYTLYEKVGLDYKTKKILPVLNDVMKDVIR